jgi:ABC-type phosphate/phosphonate transport system substrate-binding protein
MMLVTVDDYKTQGIRLSVAVDAMYNKYPMVTVETFEPKYKERWHESFSKFNQDMLDLKLRSTGKNLNKLYFVKQLLEILTEHYTELVLIELELNGKLGATLDY